MKRVADRPGKWRGRMECFLMVSRFMCVCECLQLVTTAAPDKTGSRSGSGQSSAAAVFESPVLGSSHTPFSPGAPAAPRQAVGDGAPHRVGAIYSPTRQALRSLVAAGFMRPDVGGLSR